MPKNFHLERLLDRFRWFLRLTKKCISNLWQMEKVWNLLIQSSWVEGSRTYSISLPNRDVHNTKCSLLCSIVTLVASIAISRQTIQKYLTNKKLSPAELEYLKMLSIHLSHLEGASLFYRPNFTPLTSLEVDKNLPFEQLAGFRWGQLEEQTL